MLLNVSVATVTLREAKRLAQGHTSLVSGLPLSTRCRTEKVVQETQHLCPLRGHELGPGLLAVRLEIPRKQSS